MARDLPATPSFDSFGALPEFTIGDGIPNDAFAISTASFGGTEITIGMSATERFSNPEVDDDGAGTYFAGAGFNDGTPGSTSGLLGATWNFNIFIGLVGGGRTTSDFDITLTYDFDPAVGNGDLGSVDISLGTLLELGFGLPEIQASENLLFDTLATDLPPVIDAPGVPFDPNAPGTYEFTLTVAEFGGGPTLASVAIDVVVEAPEPATLALFGIGLAGMGFLRRRKSN